MKDSREKQRAGKEKKHYDPPRLFVHGTVEKITGWSTGSRGKFHDHGSMWGPWTNPQGS